MKKFLLVSALVLSAGIARAAVNCNEPNFHYINDNYVCLSPDLKNRNNRIEEIENNLKRPPERLQHEIKSLKQAIARETGDEPAVVQKRNKLEQRLKEVEAQLRDFRKDADEQKRFIGRILEDGRNCADEDCMKEVFDRTLAGLVRFNRQSGCQLPKIEDDCEVYVYATQNRSKESEDIFLTDKYKTYQEKIKINRPQKCVYLFLTSGMPQVWDIYMTEDTDLRAVYVGSSQPQLVRGYSDKTNVVVHRQNELLRDAENCFRSQDDLNPKTKNNFLDRAGVAKERIIYLADGKIGENAPVDAYVFNKANVSSKVPSLALPPLEKGWNKLIEEKKVRPVTEADIEHIKKSGIINIDNHEFLWRQKAYRKLLKYKDQLIRDGYVITGDIDRLPKDAEHKFIFVEAGHKIPENLKINPTFDKSVKGVGMFSRTYLMLPIKADNLPPLLNCNRQDNVLSKVICADDNLRQKALHLTELFDLHYQYKPEMISAYQVYGWYRLNGCQDKKCLDTVLTEATAWLENKIYLTEDEDAQSAKCQIKFSPDCEVYAFSSTGGADELKGQYISEDAVTYNTKVKVNQPGKCVVLFLSSYSPMVWDIYTTPATDLQAVVVTGHDEQMLRGMKQGVQTKVRFGNHIQMGDDVCLPYHVDKNQMADAINDLYLGIKKVNLLDKPIVGEEVDDKFYEYNPKMIDGEFLDLDIAPGRAGLEQLIQAKKLKRLTKEDVKKIKEAGYSFIKGIGPQGNDDPFVFWQYKNYVLLDNIDKLPSGLEGGAGVILMLPQGINLPQHNQGGNDFYSVNLPVEAFKK